HAAFGYWEERYGIEQIAINGLSSSSEPSQKDLTKIIEQAREHNLDYIIFEQNSSNRVSEIIQDHIGAEALTIHNLAVLTYQDIENEENYHSLIGYNLEILDKDTKYMLLKKSAKNDTSNFFVSMIFRSLENEITFPSCEADSKKH